MTQGDLATAIGVPLSRIQRYELGQTEMSARILLRIAITLDAPPSWLYGISEPDHWPNTIIDTLLADPDLPAMVAAFTRIRDGQARRRMLALAEELAAQGQRRRPPPEPEPEPVRGRILLVNGAPEMLLVFGAFLRTSGYEVVPAHSPREALALLCDEGPFDVLVTERSMTPMSGAELVERASRLYPGLPTVITCGQAPPLRDARPDAGVLVRPFGRRDLLAAVERVRAAAGAAPEPGAQ